MRNKLITPARILFRSRSSSSPGRRSDAAARRAAPVRLPMLSPTRRLTSRRRRMRRKAVIPANDRWLNNSRASRYVLVCTLAVHRVRHVICTSYFVCCYSGARTHASSRFIIYCCVCVVGADEETSPGDAVRQAEAAVRRRRRRRRRRQRRPTGR